MSGAVELAQGYVSLSVSTRGIGTEINNVFRQGARGAERHGREAGQEFGKGFNRGSDSMFKSALKLTAVGVAVRQISKGMPDLTFGLEKGARMATLLTGALTAAAGAGAPVLALAGGLAAGFATAGAGVGAFAGLVKPAFTTVFEAVGAVTEAETAYNEALASGDKEAAAEALKERTAAMAKLTPVQREATLATASLVKAFKAQSEAFATPYIAAYTRGVTTVQGLLPELTRVAKPAGDELLRVFNAAEGGLKSQGFKEFIDFLAREVGPQLRATLQIVIDLGATMVNTLMAAAPVANVALGIIQNLTGELRAASETPGLAEFFKEMIEPAKLVGDLIGNVVRAVGALIKAAMPLAGPVLEVLNEIVVTLKTLFESNNFAGFVQNIGGILKATLPLFSTLGEVLGQVFNALSGQVLAVMPKLVPAIINLAHALGDVLIGLSPLLPAIIDLASVLLGDLAPALFPIITVIRTLAMPVVEGLTKLISAIVPPVEAFVLALLASVQPAGKFSETMGKVRDMVMNLAERALPVFVGWFKIVAPIFKQVGQAIVENFLKNLPLIKQIFGEVAGIVMATLGLIRARVDSVLKLVQFIWDNFGDTILSIASRTFGAILVVIREALKIIKNIINLATNILTGNWKGAWENIKNITRSVLRIVWTVVKTIIGNVTDVIKGLVNYVLGRFKERFSRIKNAIIDPIKNAKDRVADMLGRGRSGLVTLFTNAVTAVGKALDKIRAVAAKPINFVINTIYNDGIRAALNLIPGVDLPRATPVRHRTGGVLAGRTPGIDVKRYRSDAGDELHLSGGEGILVPEAVDMLGGERGIKQINDRARKRRRYAGGGVVWPTVGRQTSTYGGHDGVDINRGSGWEDYGDPIFAFRDGVITYVGSGRGYGQAVFHRTKAGEVVYGHTSSVSVRAGQSVKAGQIIARIGNTGRSSAPHLHFGIPGGTFGQAMGLLNGSSFAGKGSAKGTIMDWIGSGTEKLLKRLTNKLTAGLDGPYAAIAQSAGEYAVEEALKWAKKSPKALWNSGVGGRGGADPLAVRMQTYDTGGRLAPGYTLAYNGTGRDEFVRTAEQEKPLIGSLTLVSRNQDPKEDMDAVAYKVRVLRRGGINHRGES